MFEVVMTSMNEATVCSKSPVPLVTDTVLDSLFQDHLLESLLASVHQSVS